MVIRDKHKSGKEGTAMLKGKKSMVYQKFSNNQQGDFIMDMLKNSTFTR